MNFYQECTAKTYSFLFIDPTLASDNLLHFGKTILEIIEKLIMKIFDRLDVKNQHKNVNGETTKISALSSGKIDKCEYLRSEKILPSDQRRVIEQANFSNSL